MNRSLAAILIILSALLDGNCAKVDQPVNPATLAKTIREADQIIVKESPYSRAKTLFRSRKKSDLEALALASTVVKPPAWFHCMCLGSPAIYLYHNKQETALITNQHGRSIRFSEWDSDASLTNSEAWLKWFDDRHISAPRKEVEEMQTQQKQSEREQKQWLAAMPDGLKPIWESALEDYGDVNLTPLRKALARSIPQKEVRIKALLAWYGSGAGPWSGFPSYEAAAEELLLEYDLSEIVSVIKPDTMTSEEIEGSARFLADWKFSKNPPILPKELKKALWEHVRTTSKDSDKLGRAKRAFKS